MLGCKRPGIHQPWPTFIQPFSTQVLPHSRRDRAERRALREQTTSLRTERARLQGELAALRTRLIQVFVSRQERYLEAQGKAARSGDGVGGEVPWLARKQMLGKERLVRSASVSALGLAMVPSSSIYKMLEGTLP
jgi:hypothetical protein